MDESEPRRRPRVVVVGASAGGVEALTRLVEHLPADFQLPIVVVLHVPPTSSLLPDILSRAGRLRAEHARDGAPLTAGAIQIAPPDCHVLVADSSVRVARGPKENGHRPAVDPLFRTAAAELGAGVVGVVLSGALDDGTAGLAAIKLRGGVTVVQDPSEALYPAMPTSARDAVDPDYVLPIGEIAALLVRMANGPEGPKPAQSSEEEDVVDGDPTQLSPVAVTEGNRKAGELTAFTCPECNGTLWEVQEGGLVKLRCRVGHAYTEEGYEYEKSVHLEAALWTALTALIERADFSRRLAARFRRSGHELSAKRYEDQAGALLAHAETLRGALLGLETPEPEEERAS
jgi:two-component system chemotaxis response regulator CheB